ncbi:amino acid adenylation domain-containing protein [Streptosporangium longisporum]|uniref:Carrier domain-containing protein n=1 Tax=Streptosporangium longisporum TaxID=46187 RepID=A0ABN3Y3U0_9ACTN
MTEQLSQRAVALEADTRALLSKRLRGRGTSVTVPPRPAGAEPPPSSGQERLWFMEQLAPGNTAYIIPLAMRLRGELDPAALQRAVTALVARHEALRMRFPAGPDGLPRVVVDEPGPVALHVVEAGSAERAAELVGEELIRPFDLAADALLRATLLRAGPDDHVLLLAVHHIVIDGRSLEIMGDELLRLYAGARTGSPAEPAGLAGMAGMAGLAGLADLPELAVQFGDFATWERERLAGPAVEPDAAFWRQRLAGLSDLELPTDRPRPAEQRFEGAVHAFTWDAESSEAVRELGRTHNATLYMTLLAAYQAVLARYSGQDDFAVGSPVAGRPYRELEGVVGSFVNMVTLRADTTGDPSVAEHLVRTRKSVLDALTRQDYPFHQVVNDLGVTRDPSRSVVFQVTFALNERLVTERETAGLRVSPFTSPLEVTQFDLALYVTDGGQDGLSGFFTYRTDLFDAASIERIERSMRRFLREAAADPGRRLSLVPLLEERERELLLGEWAGPGTWEPAHRTLGEMAEAQAARTPDALALVAGERSLTFAELHRAADRLARRLRRYGVGPDARVAICLDAAADAAVAILAVLKAGGAYLPLDPEQPRERLEFLLADSGAVALVTGPALRDRVPGFTGRVVEVDGADDHDGGDDGDDGAEPPLEPVAGPGDLAYVIYTSGTTGRPKGVGVQHRHIVAYLEYVRRAYDIVPGATFGLLQSLAFDFSMLMFYLPLTGGGTLRQLPRRGSGPELAEAVAGLDYLKMTPSHLAALGAEVDPLLLMPRRALVLAGEAAPAEWVRELAATAGCAIFNSYGPTETVVAVTTERVDPSAVASGPAWPIGRPLPGTRAYVLDPGLRLVPAGVAGELYIGGDTLARGYLGRPGLTAERFVADPYGEPGTRMYRTGDLVRRLEDGRLEFLGRTDHQVKIRGYRVELGEIEAALATLPGVVQGVVDLRGDRLVAWLEKAPGAEAMPVGEVRAHLQERVPDYMVPGRFTWLDRLPLQAHGKVDRAALADPEPERADDRGGHVAPRGPVEEAVAGIWAGVLDVEKVGANENFFDLGGHSLLATQVVARIRKTLPGVKPPVGVLEMFTHPTVAELAALIAERRDRAGDGPAAPRRMLAELTRPIAPADRVGSVICVPYGGANAVVYQTLADAMPAGYSLYAVAAPGREPGEEAQLPFEEVAERCVAEIAEHVPGPIVIYGHCAPGSALGVELARRLESSGRTPDALYLGGIFPFAKPRGRLLGPLSTLINDRLQGTRSVAAELRAIGGDMSGLDEEQVAFTVELMRQDGRMAERYFTDLLAVEQPRLKTPIISVVGERDPSTEFYRERFKEWCLLSESASLVVIDEAGHFFPKYRAGELARIVTETHTGDAAWRAGHSREAGGTWWLSDSVRVPAPSASASASVSSTGTGAEAGAARGSGDTSAEREPTMRRFLPVALGQLVSLTGSALTEFAVPIWIYTVTGSVAHFGLIALLALVPGIVVAPLAGAVVDRYDRRRVMIAGDLASGLAQAVMLALLLTDRLTVGPLYGLIAVVSVSVTFQRLAYQAAIPQLVPKRYLGHANGIVQLAVGTAQFLVPLIAVAMLAAIGLEGILTLQVAAYLFAVVVVLVVKFPTTLGLHRRESISAEIVNGFRFSLGDRGFRAMLFFFAAVNLFLAPMFVMISPLVLSFAPLQAAGAIAVAAGAGTVAGGVTMSLWGGPTRRRLRGVIATIPLLALSGILIGLRPNLWLIGAGAFGLSFALSLVNGMIMTIIQVKVPHRFQGRVIAVNTMIAAATVPLGFGVIAPLAGPLLDPLLAPAGPLAGTVGAVIGTGPGRGIALLYLLCGACMVLLVIAGTRIRVLSRFDEQVPDARPDDLVGLEELHRARASSPVPAPRQELAAHRPTGGRL